MQTNKQSAHKGILALLILTASFSIGFAQTIQYKPIDDEIPNPERGLFHYDDDRKGEMQPLDEAELINKRKQNQTVVYRHYTLVGFKDKDLTPDYLNFLNNDAAIARRAGVKMIVRFAYTDTAEAKCVNKNGKECDTPDCVNPYDPPEKQVLTHLEQLRDYFRQNSDVIALVQTGFIGAYGEWFYGNSEFGCGDHPKYGPRANVVWRLLEILPSNRMIALRTPYYKRAIKAEWEKSGKPQNQIRDFYARIGFHDDGFLADPTDINTFRDDTDRQQVKAETMTTPMVGETSGHSLAPDNHYPSWANAKAVAAAYHWSLVSATDDGFVFSKGFVCRGKDAWVKWDPEEKCKDKTIIDRWCESSRVEFRNGLGYRFVLLDATLPEKAVSGQEIEIKLNLKNDGWASLFNPRPVYLVLRNVSSRKVNEILLDQVDPRNWNPHTMVHLKTMVTLPHFSGDFTPGSYELLLYLPDAMLNKTACALKGCDSSDFAIRFANENVWDVEPKPTGLNRLNARISIQ